MTLIFQTGSIYKDFFGRHFYATGSALLDHRIGRTGHVGLVYARGVGFPGMIEPVFSDTVTANADRPVSTGADFVIAWLRLGFCGPPPKRRTTTTPPDR
jgi:hypothetical protein